MGVMPVKVAVASMSPVSSVKVGVPPATVTFSLKVTTRATVSSAFSAPSLAP